MLNAKMPSLKDKIKAEKEEHKTLKKKQVLEEKKVGIKKRAKRAKKDE